MRRILIIFMMAGFFGSGLQAQNPDSLLLKDYHPQSVYQTPRAGVKKAAYPVIDVHSHDYAANAEEIDQWVRNMDAMGIEKTIILSKATGAKFDSLIEKYSRYPDRFAVWCGIDYTGYQSGRWPKNAIAELERCFKKGAGGVGELGDKGLGLTYSEPTSAKGMHINDKRMKPILEKCAELDMPVNIHIAEPYWMYLPMDSTNDGLMNAFIWQIDTTKENILLHGEMIQTLKEAVRDNPQTTFIACHFANCSYDLKILGNLLKKYPNLYADISARYSETATIPRYMKTFYAKYQNRLLYGTDMGFNRDMYKTTFRILESADEHFYETNMFNYHWPLYGFNLPSHILRKIYRKNALKILDL